MNVRVLSPQEVIIKELIDYSSSERVYDLSTLQFLKMHAHGKYQLHWITCSTLTKVQEWYYFLIELDRGYWECDHIFRTGPLDSATLEKIKDFPRAFLFFTQTYKGLIEPSFCAFGEVVEKDTLVRTVRLVSTNHLVLEDQVEQGLVLFTLQDVMEEPIWAELYDEAGTCLNRHCISPSYKRRHVSGNQE